MHHIAVTVNTKFWFVYHGCLRSKSAKRSNRYETDRTLLLHSFIPDAFTPKMFQDGQDTRTKYMTFFVIAYRALLVSCIWLVTALFDGDYIVCCFAEKPEELTDETIQIQANSQLAAWILLILIVGIGTIATCFFRCSDKHTYLENLYDETYRQKFEDATKKKAENKAEEDARTFILVNIGNAYKSKNIIYERDKGNNETDNRNKHSGNGSNDTDSGSYATVQTTISYDSENIIIDSGNYETCVEEQKKNSENREANNKNYETDIRKKETCNENHETNSGNFETNKSTSKFRLSSK